MLDVDINVGDVVKFKGDDNIYEVTGIVTDKQTLYYIDDKSGVEFRNDFSEIES